MTARHSTLVAVQTVRGGDGWLRSYGNARSKLVMLSFPEKRRRTKSLRRSISNVIFIGNPPRLSRINARHAESHCRSVRTGVRVGEFARISMYTFRTYIYLFYRICIYIRAYRKKCFWLAMVLNQSFHRKNVTNFFLEYLEQI